MSRSGYSEDGDYQYMNLYRAAVERSINGKRGQTFLQELAKSMDEMPEKRLITKELVTSAGEMCSIGVVCKARGIDVSKVDVYNPHSVGKAVGISQAMAAEIEYYNDEVKENETPEQRWVRMRKWVGDNLKKADA